MIRNITFDVMMMMSALYFYIGFSLKQTTSVV